jgi:adenosylmethionine-8-amino-7-oxononanoate aminotransferase
MISDDVAAGWGKFGCWHSHEKLSGGVQADISVLGKGLTAGYAPLSAIVVNDKIYRAVSNNLLYGHTQKPYIGGIAAVKAVSEIILKENLFKNVENIERKFHEMGDKLVSLNKIISYRSFGTFVGFDLNKKYTSKNLLDYGFSATYTETDNLKISAPLNSTNQYFEDLEKILFSLE